MRRPEVDLSSCADCDGCVALCPEVFARNEAGYIEVRECGEYPEALVNEAIIMCPSDCICWVEDEEPTS